MKKIFLLFSMIFTLTLSAATTEEMKVDNQKIENYSEKIASLYQLNDQQTLKNVTADVLASPYTKESAKESILKYHRQIYVFKYPSDGLSVYGFISFTPHHANQPLEVLFRGGNRTFGLLNPGDDLATYQDFTVISSVLRGGISEGQDEFGVADLADTKNLIEYIPTLEKLLHIQIQPSHTFALGESRGGMEMFLALARYPELQDRFDKVISLSGLLDMNKLINSRDDMKQMFIDEFGLQPGVNDEQWIAARNPIAKISLLKKSLPILIVQGTHDQRVDLTEGRDMTQKLEQNGNTVTYWEISGGDHSLTNAPQVLDQISDWIK